MAAGLATLRLLQNGTIYQTLEERAARLFNGLASAAEEAGVPTVVNRVGSLGSVFFTTEPVTDFAAAKASRADLFRQFYAEMLKLGIYLAPSPFEAWFISAAHDEENIENTISCAARSFNALQGKSY
jgi:glutamate-1-semialdehyde 2,1-aminomutase